MYEEKEERFTKEEIKKGVEDFLKYVGYTILQPKYIGFALPDIHVERKEGNKKHEVIGVIKKDISEAIEGFRELAAAKCVLGSKVDYALILPPVSEYFFLAFLIREEEWWFTVKNHSFMMWLVNPDRDKVDCFVGWPQDKKFEDYFSLTGSADGIIGQEASKKMMDEEF
ncbi:MAG: hypothetical protein C4549_06640 [Deltaproteobacteria bacterium]|jgi:hypothetical protein|nr:MAG: hypothetical protein C4549_06640 [Deltaproteobacteria bacterium]